MAFSAIKLGSNLVRGNVRGSLAIDMACKVMFFDREHVQRAMDRATNNAMSHAAARIKRIAQTSMRYVSQPKKEGKARAVSAPGEPPRAVRPHPWVRKHLYFFYDRVSKTAVIGPVGFPRGSGAPHNLEFGGLIEIRNPRRRRRHIGGGGEVRIGGRASRTTKPTTDQFGRTQMVTYAHLYTAGQVAHADRLNEQLYGPASKTKQMAARPFMGPALRAEAPKMPRLWANSVRG